MQNEAKVAEERKKAKEAKVKEEKVKQIDKLKNKKDCKGYKNNKKPDGFMQSCCCFCFVV